MGPQAQEVDKSILFETEIRAIDPQYPDEGVRTWHGVLIKALSWKQAEEYCLHQRGFLKVTSVTLDHIAKHDLIIDATSFDVNDDLGNNSIGQGTDSTNSDEACSMTDCCAMADEEVVEEVEGIADGDLVMLKSSGPLMTVRSANQSWCECNYYNGIELVQADFPTDSLVYIAR